MSFPSEQPLDQTREESNEGNSTQLAAKEPVVLDGEVELDSDVEASSEGPTRLPVPSGSLRSQVTHTRAETKRPSLWTRIKMRSRGAAPAEARRAAGVISLSGGLWPLRLGQEASDRPSDDRDGPRHVHGTEAAVSRLARRHHREADG